MPRSGSGTYTLPSGNPVVTGTTIESNWANTTLSDIATTLSDSLSRSGQGGMTAALRIADGTQGAPGVGFANETSTGLYRAGTGEVWAVVQGAQTLNLDANGVYVPADKTTTVDGAFVFNEAGADKDARFEGDTDANLLFTDASTDRVGVGTNTPTAKLDVNGDASLNGAVVINEAGADKDTRIEGDTDANLVFVDASTDRVGVGTSAPATKLNVRGATQAKEVAVRWERSTDGAVAGGLGYFYDAENSVAVGSVTNHPLKLITNDTTRVTLDASGNVGIGTTSMAGRLNYTGGFNAATVGSFTSLVGQGAFGGGISFQDTNYAGIYAQDAGGSLMFFTGQSGSDSASSKVKMKIDSSGNVGIGTTSTTGLRLHSVAATGTYAAQFYANTGGAVTTGLNSFGLAIGGNVSGGSAEVNIIYGSAGGGLAFNSFNGTTIAERMRLDSSGNIVAGASVALATTATDGFLYVPTCAGTPTGTPTAITGMAPIVVNTTNNKLYFYSGGAWRDAGP